MWLSYQWQTLASARRFLRPAKQKIEAEGFQRDAILKVCGKTNVNTISTPVSELVRWYLAAVWMGGISTVNTFVSSFTESLCGTAFSLPLLKGLQPDD